MLENIDHSVGLTTVRVKRHESNYGNLIDHSLVDWEAERHLMMDIDLLPMSSSFRSTTFWLIRWIDFLLPFPRALLLSFRLLHLAADAIRDPMENSNCSIVCALNSIRCEQLFVITGKGSGGELEGIVKAFYSLFIVMKVFLGYHVPRSHVVLF